MQALGQRRVWETCCVNLALREVKAMSAHFECATAESNSAGSRLMFITATTVGYGETWVTTHAGRYERDRLKLKLID